MGSRGPVPKRSSQRRRVNKPEIEVETAASPSTVVAPEPDADWHPIARMWFESHGRSGQSVWFQPSDWAEAFFLAEVMSEALFAGSINGPKLSAILGGSSRLMTTEGDRRRLRIELERPNQADADEDAAVAKLDDYRSRFSG